MDDDFAWDDLLDYIGDGKVVPIIGQELIEAEYEGRRTSLQRLLAERLAAKEKLDVSWNRHTELNDAVSAYLEKPRSKAADLYPRIARSLKELAPPFPIPTPLIQLAEIRPLDLFLSVTFDSLMARALDQVRHAGNPVTKEIAFSINESTAAQKEALRARPEGIPVVFNLFGRASSMADYAIHDEDALEFIHQLVSRDVPPPDWLLSELRSRHPLILGLHLPDWLSRFVLRAATRDRMMLAQRVIFITTETDPSGTALADFLQRFALGTRINVFQGSAEAFVTELHRRWMERNPARDAPGALPGTQGSAAVRGRIFISYSKADQAAVERLHSAIESLGGDAWFDKTELGAGDHWESKILPQIQREARLFVPVISDRTASRDEGYVFQEWREAIERSKKIIGRNFIVPVVIDADYTGNLDRYRALIDEFPAFQSLHVGSAPNGEPDEALRTSLIAEIRAMRRQES
jgi:TIR domain/SIR2-like domain